jgi:hypothetical protein
VVIVDTTVWIDYIEGVTNRETDWVHAELDRQRLGLTDVIFCEVELAVIHPVPTGAARCRPWKQPDS